jgi:DNA-binding CsgD family transcriptional regulator
MNNAAILTNRESEVAELIAWGATKKDVANQLFISERTVENHTRSIYEKTEVTKSNELSAWWFCTKFNISFNLSPIKRQIVAVVLLLIILPHEFSFNNDSARRNARGRRANSRVRTRRVEFEDNTYLIDF